MLYCRRLFHAAAQPGFVADEIQDQHTDHDDQDQFHRRGRGDADFPVDRRVEDLDGSQLETGADEEDDGAQRDNRRHEGIDETRNEGGEHDRQHDLGESGQEAGAEIRRGLFDLDMDLMKLADSRLDADGQKTEDAVQGQDHDPAGQLEGRGAEGKQITDAENRPGKGESGEGSHFNERAAEEFPSHDDVGQKNADDRADDGRHETHADAVINRLIGCKIKIVGQNDVVCDPEDLVEGCHENHGKADENRPGGDHGDDDEGNLDQRGDLSRLRGDRFAADCRECLPLEQIIMNEEDQDAGGDQNDGEYAPHIEIGFPGDHGVGVRRQKGGPPAQDGGVAELGDGHDEDQKPRLEQPRREQRDGDRPEDGRLRRPHVIGALFEIGVERHQCAFDHHVGERNEGQGLGDDDAAEAVKLPVEVEHPGDEAVATEQDDEREGKQVRGGDQRNEGDDLQWFSQDPGPPRRHVGETETDDEADHGIDHPEEKRVVQGLIIVIFTEKILIILQRESRRSPEALDEDHDDRVKEKEGEQQEQKSSQDVDQVCIQKILYPAPTAGL